MNVSSDNSNYLPRRKFLGGTPLGGVTTIDLFLSSSEDAEANYGSVRRTSRRTARRTSHRVARRTSRRVSVLPVGYRTVYVGGAPYYERSGSIYIELVFD